MRLVIKIGGSVLFKEHEFNKDYLFQLIKVLKKLQKKHHLIVSIGGGKPIRNFLKSMEQYNLTDEEKEWIIIEILHAYARTMAYMLKTEPILDLKKVNKKTRGVVSGIAPGRSTDANAVICAQKIKAQLFIKLTDIDGIYDKDPDKFENAKKLDKIYFKDLDSIKVKTSPGSYGILDPMALDILKKTKIKTIVMNGDKPEKILRVIKGAKIGTTIE